MRFVFLMLLLAFSLSTFANSESAEFTIYSKKRIYEYPNIHLPVMGDRASTSGNLKFNFDKMPGGQITDPITMNALSLGLGSRVEFGLIPWVYSGGNDSFMKYGVTIKYNFYKSRKFQWAIGGSQIKAHMSESHDERDESGMGSSYRMKFEHWWNYQFVSVNYTPVNERYNLGLTLKYTEIISKSSIIGNHTTIFADEALAYPINSDNDDASYHSTLTFDMNYQLKAHNWLGLAVGTASLNSRLNIDDDVVEDEGYSSKVRVILGGSYIFRKKLGFLDTPRLSLVYFEGDGFQFGVSTFI